jgi:hypothetical protein
VETFWIAPPLPPQVVVAGFRALSDRKPDIMQLDVRSTAIAANVEHEKLHTFAFCFSVHGVNGFFVPVDNE